MIIRWKNAAAADATVMQGNQPHVNLFSAGHPLLFLRIDDTWHKMIAEATTRLWKNSLLNPQWQRIALTR